MIRLFSFLWTGCWHKWKVLQRISVFASTVDYTNRLPSKFRYELQCERCGDVKGRDA